MCDKDRKRKKICADLPALKDKRIKKILAEMLCENGAYDEWVIRNNVDII